MKDYDDAERIRAYLGDLHSLSELAKLRREAGYNRKENLHQFLVLGRYRLDSCGNFDICSFRRTGQPNSPEASLDWLHGALPKIIPWEDLFKFLGTLSVESRLCSLPRESSICDECGEGWTVENAHDAVCYAADSEQRSYRHALCDKFHQERKTTGEFVVAFHKAGLGDMLCAPIPNEYWDDEGAPWLLMRTPKGNIKIGWRKRVISVDWSGLVEFHTKNLVGYEPETLDKKHAIEESFSAQKLFPDENVTKDLHLIHAWGYEKLIEYLTKISSVAQIGRFAKNR